MQEHPLSSELLADALQHIENLPLAERVAPLNELHDQLGRQLDSATALPLDG